MSQHDAIGIDPDSCACVATLVRRDGTKPISKKFLLTSKGRNELAGFIESVPNCLVGIEGRRGQSSPLEDFFSKKEIVFYSVPALKIENYRKAMVGVNKNNANDARAVAEFLLDLENKNQLKLYSEPEKVDTELRLLARQRYSLGQILSSYSNKLWKILKLMANDLYVALKGEDDNQTSKIRLASRRFLNLLLAQPEISTWIDLSKEELLELSGGKKTRGWENFVEVIQNSCKSIVPLGVGSKLVITQTVKTMLDLMDQKAELDFVIEALIDERPVGKALVVKYKGLGAFSAALLIEEIITINRFKNDDHLASYCGMTKRDCSTGKGDRQIQPYGYNSRMKYAFLNFAKGYLLNNKGSHLDKYHTQLLKRGMSRLEALKRIGRALLRETYRFLKDFEKPQEVKKGKSVAIDSNIKLASAPMSNTTLPINSIRPKKIAVKSRAYT